MTYDIVSVKGHYEIIINGELYCTADSYREAEEEIQNYEKQHK